MKFIDPHGGVKGDPPKPVLQFRVKADKERFFDVKLFRNRKDMYAYVGASGLDHKNDFLAITHVCQRRLVRKGKKPLLDRKWLGEIVFSAEDTDIEVIAHESAHAGYHSVFVRSKGQKMTDRKEEAVAAAAGSMAAQIVHKITVHGDKLHA